MRTLESILAALCLLATTVFATPDKAGLHRARLLTEAQTLLNQGHRYSLDGRYGDAEPLLKRALSFREELLGPTDTGVAEVKSALGNLYRHMNLLDQAIPLYQSSLQIREAALGPRHPLVAQSLVAMGNASFDQAQPEAAEAMYLKAIKIYESNPDPGQPKQPARLFVSLGLVYDSQGNYDRAESAMKKALGLFKERLGSTDRDSDVAMTLFNLADIRHKQGQFALAEEALRQSLAIHEGLSGAQSMDVGYCLIGLGDLYRHWGKLGAARSALERARSIHGMHSFPRYAVAGLWGTLADLHRDLREYASAESLYHQAWASVSHPSSEVYNWMVGLALSQLGQGQTEPALRTFEELYAGLEQRLQREAPALSDTRLLHLLESFQLADDWLFSTALATGNHELSRQALAATLLHKGRTISETALLSQVLNGTLSEADRDRFELLRILRSRFSGLALRGSVSMLPETYQNTLQKLDADADALEEELARSLGPLRMRRSLPGPREIVERVRQQLPKDAVLIEYVQFTKRELGRPEFQKTNRPHYLVFVLAADGRQMQFDLGEAEAIDTLSRGLADALASPSGDHRALGHQLYRQIIEPLLPSLRDARRLFVSLEGELQRIPFDALQIGKGSSYLGERFELSYVMSGRDLLAQGEAASGHQNQTSVVVLANPNADHLSQFSVGDILSEDR